MVTGEAKTLHKGKIISSFVLGSKKTQAKRLAVLREEGFDDEDFARIHSPIGLDLGGRRAEEIAISVIAEMIAVSHGR